MLGSLWVGFGEPLLDLPELRTTDDKGRAQPPRYDVRPGALVVDATGLREIAQLEQVRRVLRPAMRGLAASGRVIVLATDLSVVRGVEAKAVASHQQPAQAGNSRSSAGEERFG